MRLLWLSLLPLLAGCYGPRWFAPREHRNGTGPDGQPAALYTIAVGPGPQVAEVRVWSAGARARFTDDDREIVELHVGFELENNGPEPLRLDVPALVCEDLSIDGLLQPPLPPSRVQGDGRALPGSTARVDAWFEPAADAPRDIDGFAVRFAVRAGDAEVLLQGTPFAPWVREYRYDPYPGWWGPFGWGFGFGYWHGHRYCP